MLSKKRIISIDVSYGTYYEFVSAILHMAVQKVSAYVCVANVHMLIEAHNSPKFASIVNQADLVTPDGMPLARSFGLLHQINQERVDGMGLLPVLLNEAAQQNLSVFFYGGSQNMLNATEAYIKRNYPELKIAGLYSPPFRALTEDEKQRTANKISVTGANLVFVVLGCPKQEIWMSEMKGKIPAVMIGVGGALPVMVGLQRRAPQWMQKNSLEWLYRLIQEPGRLFKRYLTTNSQFLYLIAKAKMKTKNGTIS